VTGLAIIFRLVAVTSTIVVASLLTATPAGAECFVLTGKSLLEDPNVPLIFSGTVVEVTRTGDEGARVTFEVDRVWKGSVSKRFDVYLWDPEPETPRFGPPGEPYVVAAAPLSNLRARQGVGLRETDALAFAPVQCSGALSPDVVRELGAGQPPK
jgi:hypothetical protein